ncbi:hypothetical protein M885DRAFT_513172 [Pelagophyceae sp. CCMP2097]|nr:hypothetical protein M885DRAFT_513172 [Pelagophyceae sp. CCMP2097]
MEGAAAVRRIKRLGKVAGPEQGASHLALRYGARVALLRAFALEARNRGRLAPARVKPETLDREDMVAIWRYVSTQTHIASESAFWLCLSPVRQIQLCGLVSLCRVAPVALRGRGGVESAWARDRVDRGCYVLLKGDADIRPLPEGDVDIRPLPEGDAQNERAVVKEASPPRYGAEAPVPTYADVGAAPAPAHIVGAPAPAVAEAVAPTDSSMLDGAVVRPRPPAGGDVRGASHVFGSVDMPQRASDLLRLARVDAKLLVRFMLFELQRAAKHGLISKAPDAADYGVEDLHLDDASAASAASGSDGVDADDVMVASPLASPTRDDAADVRAAAALLGKCRALAADGAVDRAAIEDSLAASPSNLANHVALALKLNGAAAADETFRVDVYDLEAVVNVWLATRADFESRHGVRSAPLAPAAAARATPAATPAAAVRATTAAALVDGLVGARRLGRYVFGADEGGDEAPADDYIEEPDWTWAPRQRFHARFSSQAEYLAIDALSAGAVWEAADAEAPAPGAPGDLSTSEVLALRARGLGFLAPHAFVREFAAGDVLCEEGAPAAVVYLTLRGCVALERRRDLDDGDDEGVHAALKSGLFMDTVVLETLSAPVLVGDMPAVLGGKQSLKVVACGEVEGGAGAPKFHGNVRCVGVDAAVYAALLRQRPAQFAALEQSATLRLAWLDEKKALRCAARAKRRREADAERAAEAEPSEETWAITLGPSHGAGEYLSVQDDSRASSERFGFRERDEASSEQFGSRGCAAAVDPLEFYAAEEPAPARGGDAPLPDSTTRTLPDFDDVTAQTYGATTPKSFGAATSFGATTPKPLTAVAFSPSDAPRTAAARTASAAALAAAGGGTAAAALAVADGGAAAGGVVAAGSDAAVDGDAVAGGTVATPGPTPPYPTSADVRQSLLPRGFAVRGRSWKLWSSGAVLALEPKHAANALGVPQSFYGGAAQSRVEMLMPGGAGAFGAAPGPPEDEASRARRVRLAVSLEVCGSLGSFAAPGLFDHLPHEAPRASAAVPAPGASYTATTTRPRGAADDEALRRHELPSAELLRASRSVPLLEPCATVTRERRLHGKALPVLRHARLPESAHDDSVPPPDPLRLYEVAHVARERAAARVPRGALRDPHAQRTALRLAQLALLTKPPKVQDGAARQTLEALHPRARSDVAASRPGARAPKPTAATDAQQIDGAILRALAAVHALSPTAEAATRRYQKRVEARQPRREARPKNITEGLAQYSDAALDAVVRSHAHARHGAHAASPQERVPSDVFSITSAKAPRAMRPPTL